MSTEPAIRARLSPTNEALFETVEDYLLWTAQIATFKQFHQYFLKVKAKGSAIQLWRDSRAWDKRGHVETVLKKTMCTDGSTLFGAMQKQVNQKPR